MICLKPFIRPRKSKSNFRIEKIIYLETNGRESDENGSDYNSDFGEDQDSSGEFLISDMDDEQKKKKTK